MGEYILFVIFFASFWMKPNSGDIILGCVRIIFKARARKGKSPFVFNTVQRQKRQHFAGVNLALKHVFQAHCADARERPRQTGEAHGEHGNFALQTSREEQNGGGNDGKKQKKHLQPFILSIR